MSADDRYWNREQLYEEVWATPMRTLGLKYGISDVGLAKVCRKLSIPLPGRGHWARIGAGHAISKPPLSLLKTPIMLEKPATRVEPPKIEVRSDEPEQAQIEKLERADAQVFLQRGNLSHPLIVQAREVLKHAHADNRQILNTQDSCLDVRVSRAGLDRALRVMATLIHAIESEGFSVAVGAGHREKTVANIHGQEVKFGLVERVDRVELASPPKGAQPLLRCTLSLQMHEALRQRISVHYHLEGLTREELDAYPTQQLKAAASRSHCLTRPRGRGSIKSPKAFRSMSTNSR